MKAITYTKKEIVKRVAERLSKTVDGTSKYIDETFKVMKDMLCEDELRLRIEIRNFGVFEVKPTKAKPRARNPRTNEEVYVPAHKKTHFKPGKIVKTHLSKPLT
ncbi:MAG: integration host factor subunit beta [Candidatus Marinimicrobia bacterium]|nr:integration host factor subunit beta [Candidatus Neomarinimicrobiota bacterium]NQT97551.1 integration host factor subunit beta [Candidatus Neomarinimicrobiota bacterium]